MDDETRPETIRLQDACCVVGCEGRAVDWRVVIEAARARATVTALCAAHAAREGG